MISTQGYILPSCEIFTNILLHFWPEAPHIALVDINFRYFPISQLQDTKWIISINNFTNHRLFTLYFGQLHPFGPIPCVAIATCSFSKGSLFWQPMISFFRRLHLLILNKFFHVFFSFFLLFNFALFSSFSILLYTPFCKLRDGQLEILRCIIGKDIERPEDCSMFEHINFVRIGGEIFLF